MEYDVVVIGAGQAGLAMGYYLKESPLKVLILDKNQRVGEVWRNRYDSLVLFTPRTYSALPGLALEGDQTGYPNKDEIVDYLERYSQKFDLPIQFNSDVKKVYKEGNMFNIQVNESLIQTKQVVVATGPLHTPRIPSFSQELSKDIFQLHTSEYKNPSQLIDGAVLVVGGGNSGTQIAAELSNDRETFLSIGQSLRFLPLKIVSKSIFWWFDKLGILKANRYTFLGKKLKNQGDPIFGFELKQKIKSGRVQLKGRTTQVQQNKIIFEDQSFLRVNNVIWATGFISNYSWISMPGILDSNGDLVEERGITSVSGLYFLGLPWQYRKGSSILYGVGDDAEYLYQHIVKAKE